MFIKHLKCVHSRVSCVCMPFNDLWFALRVLINQLIFLFFFARVHVVFVTIAWTLVRLLSFSFGSMCHSLFWNDKKFMWPYFITINACKHFYVDLHPDSFRPQSDSVYFFFRHLNFHKFLAYVYCLWESIAALAVYSHFWKIYRKRHFSPQIFEYSLTTKFKMWPTYLWVGIFSRNIFLVSNRTQFFYKLFFFNNKLV